MRGGLAPEVSSDARSVRFLDEGGAAVVTYAGLTVFDADGRDVPARFEREGALLTLAIDESDARCPSLAWVPEARIDGVLDPPSASRDEEGCSCVTAPATGAGPLLVLAGLLGLRRRIQ